MLIDIQAIRQAAKNKASTPCYPANAANAANGKHGGISNVSNVSKVAGGGNALPAPVQSVAVVASSHGIEVAPSPNPNMAPLLALATAYCDHIGASDKARKDWHSDIAGMPVEQRGELARYLRSQLPPAPAHPDGRSLGPRPAPVKPLPKFHQAQPWNAADKAYQAHHWNCITCRTAARSGHSDRCAVGQHLHQLYEQAAMPKEST